MAHKSSKLVLFMLLGSLAMTFGAIVASNSRVGASISPTTFVTSVLVSVVLFFIGGLFWVMVAAAVRKSD